MIRCRRIGLAAAGMFSLQFAIAAEPMPDPGAGWHALSIGAYSDAADHFARAPHDRTAQLGAAILRINRPPVTRSSLAEARTQFAALAAGNDSDGHAARYFLGRTQQLDPFAPDAIEAAREFEKLVATNSDDPWCRLALVKLAILRLTALPALGNFAARLAAVQPLFALTNDEATQRDLHLVVAEARLSHRLYDVDTLGHLRSALDHTPPKNVLRPDLLVQIGRLADHLGERDVARKHYELFLEENPQERRAFTVNAALHPTEAMSP